MAAIWRARRIVPGESGGFRFQLLAWRPIHRLGLAYSVRAVDCSHRHRLVDPPRHPGDACVPTAPGHEQNRENSDHRSDQETAEGDHSLGVATDVPAGAVLRLHRLHLRLRGQYLAYVAQPHPRPR